MERSKYAGTWTAIITPFKDGGPSEALSAGQVGGQGSVDEEALRGIVRRQAAAGVTGVVPVGTTGESPTTTFEEDCRIFEIVVDEARKIEVTGGRKLMVMAGTGSNCTKDAVKYTEAAKKAGADCCLVVAPYYNKPTPAGLKLHYHAIADVGLPVIVYNIKGRTGINIDTDTLMEIAQHPMIVGVKEASGDLNQMKEVLERRNELGQAKMGQGSAIDGTDEQSVPGNVRFTVLSGDDGLTLDLMKIGGDGVISVASNIVPAEVVQMVELGMAGKFDEAQVLNEKLAKLFKDIFVETNPIPVKYCASRMGLCGLKYRLPMCEPTEKSKQYLDEMLREYKLIT